MNKSRLVLASTISATISILYVVVLTITTEFCPVLKTFLKSLTGHHWTTKSLSSLALYLILLVIIYTLIKQPDDKRLNKSIYGLFVVAILGTLALFLFFSWHFFFV